jgi:hypothetical protein
LLVEIAQRDSLATPGLLARFVDSCLDLSEFRFVYFLLIMVEKECERCSTMASALSNSPLWTFSLIRF